MSFLRGLFGKSGEAKASQLARDDACGARNAKDGSVLISIASAGFTMGSTQDEVDRTFEESQAICKRLGSAAKREWFQTEMPSHPVALAAYSLGKYPVTNEQFRRFVDETSYRTYAQEACKSVVLSGTTNAYVVGAFLGCAMRPRFKSPTPEPSDARIVERCECLLQMGRTSFAYRSRMGICRTGSTRLQVPLGQRLEFRQMPKQRG